MTQLAEQPLLIPEVCGSNPVISKMYIEHLFTVSIEKTKKEAGNGPLKNRYRTFGHPGIKILEKNPVLSYKSVLPLLLFNSNDIRP